MTDRLELLQADRADDDDALSEEEIQRAIESFDENDLHFDVTFVDTSGERVCKLLVNREMIDSKLFDNGPLAEHVERFRAGNEMPQTIELDDDVVEQARRFSAKSGHPLQVVLMMALLTPDPDDNETEERHYDA